jgi:hypothetical protein
MQYGLTETTGWMVGRINMGYVPGVGRKIWLGGWCGLGGVVSPYVRLPGPADLFLRLFREETDQRQNCGNCLTGN